MSAGRLRRRVTIQRSVRVDDGYGGSQVVWEDVGKVWAAVEPLRGSERYAAQQVKNDLSHRVLMRYRPGITPQMRLVLNDRVLNIEAAINVEERNRWLELLCREVVADG